MDYIAELKRIQEGHVYSHRLRPERIIQILRVKNLKAEVVYISTTEKKNMGAVGELYLYSIVRMYQLIKVTEPAWEL